MQSTKNISLVTVVNTMAKLEESYIDRCLNVDYQGKQLKDVIFDGFMDELEREIIDITLLQKFDVEWLACNAIEHIEKHYQVYDL